MVCDLDQAQQRETSVAAIRHRGLCHYWYSELLQAYSSQPCCFLTMERRGGSPKLPAWSSVLQVFSIAWQICCSPAVSCKIIVPVVLLCIFIKTTISISEDGGGWQESGGLLSAILWSAMNQQCTLSVMMSLLASQVALRITAMPLYYHTIRLSLATKAVLLPHTFQDTFLILPAWLIKTIMKMDPT